MAKEIKKEEKKHIKGNVCPNCDGHGTSVGDECSNCKGTGRVE